nr:hypothetical protein [Parafrankia soli]
MSAPYLLVLPGGLWLVAFFVIPMLVMLSISVQTGNVVDGFRQTFNISVYWDAISTYDVQFVRSFVYGGLATLATILLAYPMAYWIAFHAGERKSTYLFLVLLPFFVSFVIRTVSWRFLLADDGIVLGNLKDAGLLPENFHVLATSFAVVAGLTYNFFPFMLLPSTSPWSGSIRACWRPRPTSTRPERGRSGESSCRFRCPGCSPAAC